MDPLRRARLGRGGRGADEHRDEHDRIAVRSRIGRPYPFAGRRTAAQRLPFRSMGAGARRCAVLVAGLALLLIAGCGGGGGPGAAARSSPSTRASRSRGGRSSSTARGRAGDRSPPRRAAGAPSWSGCAASRASAPRCAARGSPARSAAAPYRRYRAAYDGARAAAARLPGARGAEQRAVLGAVEALADGLALTPSRLPAVFLNLRRNTRTWTRGAVPRRRRAAHVRPRPGGVPVRAGAAACSCTRSRPGAGSTPACTAASTRGRRGLRQPRAAAPGRRRRAAGRPSAAASARGSTYYRYAQGTPPWISGMAQATAVQALARAARAFRAPRYAKLARQALGAFETAAADRRRRAGRRGRRALRHVLVRADDADPQRRAAGGQRAAHGGVADRAAAAPRGSPARATRAVRRVVGGFDTGAWSLYSAAGAETTLSYHQLTTGFLAASAGGPASAAYCDAARRFTRYEHEPPRIGIGAAATACGRSARGAAAASRCRRARRSRSGSTGRAAS